MAMNIEVKGHSGCLVQVVQEDNFLYVLKSTSDPSYLQRLLRQAEKQKFAAMVAHQHIRVPKIYEVKSSESNVCIKMQYVYSRNFVEFLEQAGFEQVEFLVGALKNYLEYEINQSPITKVPTRLFGEKFSEIEAKMKQTHWGENEELREIMSKAKVLFQQLPATLDLPIGLCHGDLTFSNILFNGNNYYLIDFLDNFIETPLQDIVKIRQDTAFRWSQLMYTKRFDAVRLHIIFDKIDWEIDHYFSIKYQWYRDNYQVMQLLNILRILPYVQEDRIMVYLLNILRGLLTVNDHAHQVQRFSDVKVPVIQEKKSSAHTQSSALLVPVAADKPEYQDGLPYVFNLNKDGYSLCVKSILGLDYRSFQHIYFTILKKHAQKFAVKDLLELQFKRLGIENAKVVILDSPTRDQTETIYTTIKQENISGPIFIKDADSYFQIDHPRGNGISIFPIEELSVLIPQDKSYVSVDDMSYVTNIIEKTIVGHFISAGGYAFDDATVFCDYYEKLRDLGKLYLSHVVYAMLLDNISYRPFQVKQYKDCGTQHDWEING